MQYPHTDVLHLSILSRNVCEMGLLILPEIGHMQLHFRVIGPQNGDFHLSYTMDLYLLKDQSEPHDITNITIVYSPYQSQKVFSFL